MPRSTEDRLIGENPIMRNPWYFPFQWYHISPVCFIVEPLAESSIPFPSSSLLTLNFNLVITLDSKAVSICATYFSTWALICSICLLSNSKLMASFILTEGKCWELIVFCMLTRSITWGGILVIFWINDYPLPSLGTEYLKTLSFETRYLFGQSFWSSPCGELSISPLVISLELELSVALILNFLTSFHAYIIVVLFFISANLIEAKNTSNRGREGVKKSFQKSRWSQRYGDKNVLSELIKPDGILWNTILRIS